MAATMNAKIINLNEVEEYKNSLPASKKYNFELFAPNHKKPEATERRIQVRKEQEMERDRLACFLALMIHIFMGVMITIPVTYLLFVSKLPGWKAVGVMTIVLFVLMLKYSYNVIKTRIFNKKIE